jgi:hypothetical protein
MDPSSVLFLLLLVLAVFIAFCFVLVLLLGLTYLLLAVREALFGAAPAYKAAALSRRNVLLFVSACFFCDYMADIIYWTIFARDLSDKGRMVEHRAWEGEPNCFRFHDPTCPTEFTCVFQHKTTVFTRYAFEVIVGTACATIGSIGLWNYSPPWTRVFAYYTAAYAAMQTAFLLADLLYVQVCDAYPANVISIMPLIEHMRGGRLRIMEHDDWGKEEVDVFFGYNIRWWYTLRTLVVVAFASIVSWQSFKAAHLFDAGPMSLGPHFNIAEKFDNLRTRPRPLHGGNMRHDLQRLHATDPVAGYGSIPHDLLAA